MASNIPVPFLNDGVVCDVEKNMSQGCQNIYLFYLLVFIPIAVFLSCLELRYCHSYIPLCYCKSLNIPAFREQTVIQVVLSLFRFAVMAAMIITVRPLNHISLQELLSLLMQSLSGILNASSSASSAAQDDTGKTKGPLFFDADAAWKPAGLLRQAEGTEVDIQ